MAQKFCPFEQELPFRAVPFVATVDATFQVLGREPLPLWSGAPCYRGRTVNSFGEAVMNAKPAKRGHLRKILPDRAGSVPLVEVCDGGVRELALNPRALLKPTALREAT